MSKIANRKNPKVIASPFVFQQVGKRHVMFRSGELAFEVPNSMARWFREYSLALMTAPRSKQSLKNSKIKNAPSASDFMMWLELKGALVNVPTGPRRHSLASAELLVDRAIQTWKFGCSTTTFLQTIKKRPSAITYLIELAWFVNSASVYLGNAVKYCRNKKLKSILRELLHVESVHIDLLLPDLGLTKSQIAAHDPSPNARGLVSYLNELARKDALEFICSYVLLEADPSLKSTTLRQLTSLEKTVGFKLTGFKKHFELDLAANHAELWRLALQATHARTVPAAKLDKIINSLHVTRHQLMSWHTGMEFRAKEAAEYSNALKLHSQNCDQFLRHPFSSTAFFAQRLFDANGE
jgi:hypothetical protein